MSEPTDPTPGATPVLPEGFPPPFYARTKPAPAPPTGEETAALRARLERLEAEVASLRRTRSADEPVMRRVRQRFGPSTASIALILAGVLLVALLFLNR